MKTQVIHIKDAPKGWPMDFHYVYVGRPGRQYTGYFGNPFKLNPSEPRGATIERFETWARRRLETDLEYRQKVKDLHGKTLICFCAPEPCHGDVLAKLAAELQGEQL
jgi:hypothetical protein